MTAPSVASGWSFSRTRQLNVCNGVAKSLSRSGFFNAQAGRFIAGPVRRPKEARGAARLTLHHDIELCQDRDNGDLGIIPSRFQTIKKDSPNEWNAISICELSAFHHGPRPLQVAFLHRFDHPTTEMVLETAYL